MHIARGKFPAVQNCKTNPKYMPERLGTSITEYIKIYCQEIQTYVSQEYRYRLSLPRIGSFEVILSVRGGIRVAKNEIFPIAGQDLPIAICDAVSWQQVAVSWDITD